MTTQQGRPRILVAEDDAALRRLLELRLDVDGYDVRSVVDGSDALDLIDDWKPDAMICDVMMPRISGLTVCRELRARADYADLPIILLTARVFDSDIEDVVALGGITFVNKPFNASRLNTILQSVLGDLKPLPGGGGTVGWMKIEPPHALKGQDPKAS
jgi:two-component system phosphate regulon response regulator PhoB